MSTLGSVDSKALPRHTREHNRRLLIRTLYRSGPMSRADLARETGLAKVTVSDLISDLVDTGFLEELGIRESTGPGKPAVLVDLARDSFNILAVDLSEAQSCTAALLNLNANQSARVKVDRNDAKGDAAVDMVLDLISQLMELAEKPVIGISIGSPGMIDSDGTVRLSRNMEWRNLPLQKIVHDRFQLPTIVANDANIAALGERLYGSASDSFMLITVGRGIGAGLVLDGEQILGPRHSVGEFGVVMVGTEVPVDSPFHYEETLEYWLAVPAIRKRLAAAKDDGAAREEVLRESGRRLGIVLAPLVATMDLSEVVLNGPRDLLEGPLIESTLDVIQRRTLAGAYDDLVLRVSEIGDDLVLLGCTAQALFEFLGVS